MKEQVYKDNKKSETLTEIYQTSSVQFAAVKKSAGELLKTSQFFKCRDFFSDVVYADINKVNVSMYGFKCTPKDHSRGQRFRFLLKLNSAKEEVLHKALTLIHNIEKDLRVTKTRVFKTKDADIYLVDSSSWWSKNTVRISALTYFIRQGKYIIAHKLSTEPKKFFSNKNSTIMTKYGPENTIFKTICDKYEDMLKKLSSNVLTIRLIALARKLRKDVNFGASNYHNNTGIASCMGTSLDVLFKKHSL
jgi:hypothetical protein